ncbi:MAG: carbon storage regulator CsrA [Lachnospiraceae bacterium]|jgi:carbon storage regulator
MLALSRKKGEALMINNDIEITVLDIKGEQVKIGISAPKEVPVYRKEVYIQIQEANKEASANMEGMEQLASLFGGKK